MTIIDMDKMGEALNNKADIDLNNTGVFSTSEGGVVNLTSSTPANASGKEVTSADFFQSNLLNYTTNRILEIPQDIKLELNDGTLTLKAGSTYYKCDGNFTKTTTSQDYSITNVSNGTRLVFFTGNGFDTPTVIDCNSGASEPTTGNKWFNTSNNILYSGSSGNWQQRTQYSLPLAIITVSGGAITSIDQIFNGFGYIGSTVFALPGVKVQIPNGRNEDGTCNNIIAVNNSVKLSTLSSSNNGNKGWYVSSTFTISVTGAWEFNYEKNCYINSEGSLRYSVKFAVGSVTSGKITSFTPYTVDSVVNSNEFYQLKDKAVTTDTAQTISGTKTFTTGTLRANTPILLKQNNANEGGEINFERSNNSVLIQNPFIDLWKNLIRFVGISSQNVTNIPMQLDLENNQVWIPSPAATANDGQAATTAWVNSKIQLVNELPANPVAGVLYCIPEA